MERPCGRCKKENSKSSSSADFHIEKSVILPNGLPDTSDKASPVLRNQEEANLVLLKNYCLTDDNFTPWNDWTQCLPGCKRVRFRHCLTKVCSERVPFMDDKAVMDEQWCIPDEKTELNCEELISENYKKTADVYLDVQKCEEMREEKKKSNERTKQKKDKSSTGEF